MATKKKTPPRSIASRREVIRAPKKKKSKLNPLQAELDSPLSRSFKESLAVGAAIAGPGKLKKVAAAKKELKAGLSNFVEAFKASRKSGNVKQAKEIKGRIDKVIKKKNLDAKTVFGKDPEAK